MSNSDKSGEMPEKEEPVVKEKDSVSTLEDAVAKALTTDTVSAMDEESKKETKKSIEEELINLGEDDLKHNYEKGAPYDTGQAPDSDGLFMYVPNATSKGITRATLDLLSTMLDKNNAPPEIKNWVEALDAGGEGNLDEGMYLKALGSGPWNKRDKENYVGPTRPLVSAPSNAEVKGDDFMYLLTEESNRGKHIQIPLIHSGFSITIRPPSQSQLAIVLDKLNVERAELGRSTYGLIHSNQRALVLEIIVEFILSLVVATTKQLVENAQVVKITMADIYVDDIPLLQGGLIKALFFNGVPYKRACVSSPGTCTTVYEGTMDIAELYVEQTEKLSIKSIAHIRKRTKGSVSFSDIEGYIKELPLSEGRVVSLSDSIKFKLVRPNLQEYFDSRRTWAITLTSILEETLADGGGSANKEQYLTQAMDATIANQFGHFVSEIRVNSNVSRDRVSIDRALTEIISGDNALLEKFIDSVKDFMEDSVVATYAVPSFQCPSCGGNTAEDVTVEAEKEGLEANFFATDWLMPLDMTLFTTAGLTLSYMTVQQNTLEA